MKILITCPECQGRRALWLRPGEYLECPTCLTEGTIEMHEYRTQARVRDVFIPGLKKHTEVRPLFVGTEV